MIFFKILLIINAISITQSKIPAEEKADLETLLFVTAVWRHGDRTPTSLLPSDKQNTVEMIKEKFVGLGQLTELGALQHFKLGILLRDRYSGFLSDEYSKNEIGYRSSYYNRTKMSILANQQGMFASNGQTAPKLPLIENVPKTGIVIKYLQKGGDPYVFDEVDCPLAKNADEQIFESEEFREIELTNQPFLQYIANNSGLFNLTLRYIYKINDPLTFIFAHQNDGFKLPNWATETTRKEITRLYNLKNSFDFKTKKQKRLLSGLLFTEILNKMENISCENEFGSKEKFYAYSGHDGTVAGLLAIFGINLEVFPKFSTALLIELHKQKNKSEGLEENTATFFIRLFHKNETDGNGLWEIEIPDCGNICSLEKLKEIKREYIIELKEWHNEYFSPSRSIYVFMLYIHVNEMLIIIAHIFWLNAHVTPSSSK